MANILIVEDEPSINELIKRNLQFVGHECVSALDGWQTSSIGATPREAHDIMLKYGAYNAANLDGGAYSTFVYQNKIQNSPSSVYGPRYLLHLL